MGFLYTKVSNVLSGPWETKVSKKRMGGLGALLMVLDSNSFHEEIS